MSSYYSVFNPTSPRIINLIYGGYSDRQIAKELQLCHQYVYRFRQHNGIPPGSVHRKKPRKLTPVKPRCERQLVIAYCLTLPNAIEDYPFGQGKQTALRHESNGKCFAILHERDGKLYVNVKCDPSEAITLRHTRKNVISAYQMNRAAQRHWVSVIFGGDVLEYELHDMIRRSYELTKPTEWRTAVCESYKKHYGDPREWFWRRSSP